MAEAINATQSIDTTNDAINAPDDGVLYETMNNSMSAIRKAGGRLLDIASGTTTDLIEAVKGFVSEALTGLLTYLGITAEMVADGLSNYWTGLNKVADITSAETANEAAKILTNAFPNFASGYLSMRTASALAVPIQMAAKAGFKVLTFSGGMAAVAQTAAPLLVMVAVGYAALKLRDTAWDRIKDAFKRVVNALKKIPQHRFFDIFRRSKKDDEDDDDEDDDAVTVEVDDDGATVKTSEKKTAKRLTDGGYECPYCEEKKPSQQSLAGHIAHCDAAHEAKEAAPAR